MPKGPKPRPIEYSITESGCHECTSHYTLHGYPRITKSGITMNLCRYIYMQHYGKLPKGHLVRHKCDNRLCINIEHLVAGTVQQNMQDKVERGRAWRQRPETKTSGVLTEDDIRAIRSSTEKAAVLAERYSLHKCSISRIKNRKVWPHVL